MPGGGGGAGASYRLCFKAGQIAVYFGMSARTLIECGREHDRDLLNEQQESQAYKHLQEIHTEVISSPGDWTRCWKWDVERSCWSSFERSVTDAIHIQLSTESKTKINLNSKEEVGAYVIPELSLKQMESRRRILGKEEGVHDENECQLQANRNRRRGRGRRRRDDDDSLCPPKPKRCKESPKDQEKERINEVEDNYKLLWLEEEIENENVFEMYIQIQYKLRSLSTEITPDISNQTQEVGASTGYDDNLSKDTSYDPLSIKVGDPGADRLTGSWDGDDLYGSNS